MAILGLICPNCNANLKADDTKDSWFCQYCGTKVIRDKQHIELSGEIAVNGIASTDSLLDRAFLFIEDKNFQRAFQYLERVLDADPKNWRAYIGRLLCQLKMCKIKDLEKAARPLIIYDDYNKAMRFAVGDEASMLKGLNDTIIQRLENEKLKHEDEISDIQREIVSTEQYLEDNKKDYNRSMTKIVAWTVFEVLCILVSVFFIIGTIAVLPILIISLPAVTGTIFVIQKRNKIKRLTTDYDNMKSRLAQLNQQLSQAKRAYSIFIATNNYPGSDWAVI